MEYRDLLRDFVERTRTNLALTDALPRDGEFAFFEVTQLINSLLGLVVLPREWLDSIPNTPLDILGEGWPPTRFVDGGQPGQRPTDLRQLVIGLRNAVGHFNIEWLGDGTAIVGLQFGSTNDPGSPWAAQFDVDELRRFVEQLADAVDSTLSKGGQNSSIRKRARRRRTTTTTRGKSPT